MAFAGDRLLAEGDAPTVARAAKGAERRGDDGALLVFDAVTSEPFELDLRGDETDVLARLAPSAAVTADANGADDDETTRGPGRPRLGVVGREVTLLPRHWEWLGAQPGGASAALRRLVDTARTANAGRDRRRRAQEYAYRFLVSMLGNAPDFEEATRALFAGDHDRFMRADRPLARRSARPRPPPGRTRAHTRELNRPSPCTTSPKARSRVTSSAWPLPSPSG